MSILAIKHQAINLGQGFPNFDGPEFIKNAAIEAIKEGKNQYARGYGIPELNVAIASRFFKDTGLTVNPETEVTVTSGCTEAIAASMIGLVNPGDEVILFAPFYDSYLATLSMVDAKVKTVTLQPPDFAVPKEELEKAFSNKTRAIVVNTPHNPTGKVFSRQELEFIASLCKKHNALAFTDEVYHRLTYEAEHISLASLEGMYERTEFTRKNFLSDRVEDWMGNCTTKLNMGITASACISNICNGNPFSIGCCGCFKCT